MGNHKAYTHNLETEHGRAIAEEAQQRADAKEAYKDEFKTYRMQLSRDDIDKLFTCIGRHPNVGKVKDLVDFLRGDKGFWTEELTLEIIDHNEEYDDYDPEKDRK